MTSEYFNYCQMISVVLFKVSQPSRYKQVYDGKFVRAKCAYINDEATLSEPKLSMFLN